ncbi:PREDICTED: uncharacterized protein LOC105130573 [Populus euphratica]|uniref:Uncharacterized protein LOC105130573 n=1 Tax=Populus euphratica TaxID=75702 RepID=A0AAJ6ULQ1_POPEU|nr:PREDICTED: uncharacterized protein LOC105130573 [Populus euphratica]
MSKNNKKRVAVKSHQSQFVDEGAINRVKYQNLLEDFLELQKDFVSKKRKLRTVEQKREILSAEVRFLRQRHKFFMKMQSGNLVQSLVPEKDPCMEDLVPKISSPVEDLVPGKYSSMPYQGKFVGKPLSE